MAELLAWQGVTFAWAVVRACCPAIPFRVILPQLGISASDPTIRTDTLGTGRACQQHMDLSGGSAPCGAMFLCSAFPLISYVHYVGSATDWLRIRRSGSPSTPKYFSI